MMKKYQVKTSGKNDLAWIDNGVIHIGDVKAVGKTDTDLIPVRMIQRVYLDRRGLRSDSVTLTVAGEKVDLKMPEAQEFVAELLVTAGFASAGIQ